MKIMIALCLILFCSLTMAEDSVTVERVYNGYSAVNKIYIMNDDINGKFCYIVYNDAGSNAMYCFDKQK